MEEIKRGLPITNTCPSVLWPTSDLLPVKCCLTEGHPGKHYRYATTWTDEEAVPLKKESR